jgi:hypothetical protein
MGLMLISFSYPRRLRLAGLVEPRHRLVGRIGRIGKENWGGHDIARRLVRHNDIGDQCLVGVDGDVLHYDLLLPSTPMLVESYSQRLHRSCSFVSEREIS